MAPQAAESSAGARVHDHLVVFYDDDQHLAASVTEFLAPALASGGTALVVATPEHIRRFREELEAAGVDAPAALVDERLVLLDAAATLASLMPNGCVPDGGLFREIVGGKLDEMASRGAPVMVYGEMVALLWADGNVSSAIALEGLWNDIGSHKQFRLLCAYPMADLDRSGSSDSFRKVCELHSTVIPHERLVDLTTWPEQLSHLLHDDEAADGELDRDRVRAEFVTSVVEDLRSGLLRRGEELLASARSTIAEIDRAIPS